MTRSPSVVAKRAYQGVALNFSLRCSSRVDSMRLAGSTDLTTTEARALAQSLVELADHADAMIAAKVASEERRRKWREREIAAGRMKVIRLR